jgi:hypothetical protein
MEKFRLFVFVFLSLGFMAFGQPSTEKKPSQEEIIQWLTEKFNKCLYSHDPHKCGGASEVKLKSISPCKIVISYTLAGAPGTCKRTTGTSHLPTQGFKFDGESIWYESEVIRDKNSDTDKYEYLKTPGWRFKIRKCEDDIYKRLEKAVKDLNEYCPKKKEPY